MGTGNLSWLLVPVAMPPLRCARESNIATSQHRNANMAKMEASTAVPSLKLWLGFSAARQPVVNGITLARKCPLQAHPTSIRRWAPSTKVRATRASAQRGGCAHQSRRIPTRHRSARLCILVPLAPLAPGSRTQTPRRHVIPKKGLCCHAPCDGLQQFSSGAAALPARHADPAPVISTDSDSYGG